MFCWVYSQSQMITGKFVSLGKDQIKCKSNAQAFLMIIFHISGFKQELDINKLSCVVCIYKINKFIYYCCLMIYLWQFILKMSMFFYCKFVTSGGLLRNWIKIPAHLLLHFSDLKLSAGNTSNRSEGVFFFRLTQKKCLKICYSSVMLSVKKYCNFSHRVKFNFYVPDYPSDFSLIVK